MITEEDFEVVCQDCADYIKFIYSKICFVPEEIQVSFKIGDFVHFTIEGNERDDGIIIGRSGATIQACRLFVHAYAKTNMEGRSIIIEVKDHQGSRYNPVLGKARFSRR